jgi:hypothetical protein
MLNHWCHFFGKGGRKYSKLNVSCDFLIEHLYRAFFSFANIQNFLSIGDPYKLFSLENKLQLLKHPLNLLD